MSKEKFNRCFKRSIPNFRETEAYILERIEKSPSKKLDKDVQGFSN